MISLYFPVAIGNIGLSGREHEHLQYAGQLLARLACIIHKGIGQQDRRHFSPLFGPDLSACGAAPVGEYRSRDTIRVYE